jgi:hypothetical protein
MLDRLDKYFAHLIQVAARKEHAVDLGAVLGPFLDLVEVTVVRDHRVASFFVGRFAHCRAPGGFPLPKLFLVSTRVGSWAVLRVDKQAFV